ncbi:NAD(P)-dependent oxidoreductase [Agrobacterium burrii]|uniref:D-isomer specific 2-hydroxyacid dehydrogenase NAD-binding domain-containing protein n=1 Tax=Agrobacterium burrii TaxID=2815339 RepID=A0ABS3EQR0_9HYPH|nr:NAD(P)-dependent oxidoreductase [Agrobacterium burrii]MBO0134223.1 hypothetical protein [Agrobacterium burrii]
MGRKSSCLKQYGALGVDLFLTHATREIGDADAIAQMKKGAIIINTKCGGLAVEVILAEALCPGNWWCGSRHSGSGNSLVLVQHPRRGAMHG